jgi:hypothetical protein
MPKYRIGDIWTRYGLDGEVILVPTNATLKSVDKLVMGAGAALHATWKEPDIATRFGRKLMETNSLILWDETWDIWGFQSKYHWKDDSDLDLITMSTDMLINIANQYPDSVFNLCWPAIGLGNLTKATTKPILDNLPDNVVVWSFD